MAIESVGSSNNAQIAAMLQQQVESQSVQRSERENDGDKDNSAAAVAKQAAPTVNTQGQTVGTVVNTSA